MDENKELLDIEKQLNRKKYELEKLKEEAELYELMIKINNENCDKVDIRDIYVVRVDDGIHFVKEKFRTDSYYRYHYIDILSGLTIHSCVWSYEVNKEPIKKVFPELKAYINGQAPRLLVQKLYYQANGIDTKVLKKCFSKED